MDDMLADKVRVHATNVEALSTVFADPNLSNSSRPPSALLLHGVDLQLLVYPAPAQVQQNDHESIVFAPDEFVMEVNLDRKGPRSGMWCCFGLVRGKLRIWGLNWRKKELLIILRGEPRFCPCRMNNLK